MAIVFTQRANTVNNRNFKCWDVACAAVDTGPTTQAHGFGAIPLVWFAKHVSAAAQPEVSVLADATDITITKLGAVGSVGAPYLTVFAVRPSSLMR